MIREERVIPEVLGESTSRERTRGESTRGESTRRRSTGVSAKLGVEMQAELLLTDNRLF